MAVVLETVASGTSATVTKPTGLAEGDLMVAHIAQSRSDSTALDNATRSGWTLITGAQSQSASANTRSTALFKVADSSDVAASDFAFTIDGDAEAVCGAIFRFSGAASGGVADPDGAAADDTSGDDTSLTFANTLTPAFANCILLFLTSAANSGGTSFSSQAITTNNPSWTEQYDTANTGAAGDGDCTFAGASASRPQTSATGNSTCSSGATVTDAVGLIVAVYPIVNASVTLDLASLTATPQDPALTADANLTLDQASLTATPQEPTVTGATAKWTNKDKSAAPSITNKDKS